MRLLGVLVSLGVCVTGAMAELQNVESGGKPGTLMRTNALWKSVDQHTAEAIEARAARVDALSSEEEITAYQKEKYDYFVNALGGFPERTPLNARVVGEGDGGDYRYEKIIYESQPGFYVTAVLFLPKGDGPFPGVLVPCGHSNNGKAAETYQRASILLAKNGMAALCYDPIGQGERYHFFKDDGKPLFGTTTHHSVMGVGSILTGTNIAMYRIFDGMRGLDYLESRDDIDPKRLACTGNSGGGTLTSFIMALDERVTVAAPSCYLTNFEKLLATIAPQDAEQNIFGQLANGLDHTEYIHLRAPKPTLICAATHDFFDIEGTWDTFREAKQLYTKLGYPERVNLVEANEKHGFSKPLRQAMVQWMQRWLLDVDAPVVEPDFDIHSDAEMLCTPEGQVLKLDGARSLFDLSIARNEALASEREALQAELKPDAFRAKIAKKINYILPENADALSQDPVPFDEDGPRFEIHTAPAGDLSWTIDLHAYLPKEVAEQYLATNPKTAARGTEEGTGLSILKFQRIAVGPIGWKDSDHGQESTVGHGWPGYFRAYLMGDNQLRFWIEDMVLRLTEMKTYAEAIDHAPLPVRLHAEGWTTLPALHAVALHPGFVDKLILEGGIPSWSDVVATPRAKQQLITTVHGALELYDLPDLIALCPKNSVEIRDPKVPVF